MLSSNGKYIWSRDRDRRKYSTRMKIGLDNEHAWCLGKGHATKSDEFSEKFQGGGGSFSIQRFILQILDLYIIKIITIITIIK